METLSWEALTGAVIASSGHATTALSAAVVAERWNDPSVLPAMSIGALASHLGQMIGGLVTLLDTEAPMASEVEIRSLVDLYGKTARIDDSDGLNGDAAQTIRRWATRAADEDPALLVERARAHAARLPGLLDAAEPDRLVPSALIPGVATRLSDYLRTRCVEFVVHTDDLAMSVGLASPEADPGATAVALEVLIEMCRARVGDAEVLRALARPNRVGPDVLRAL